jgi:hypothetical protein
MVRQKTFTNVTNLWEDGPINNLSVQANKKPMVGLQACWFGNLYGDSEYTHSPQFNDPNVSTTVGSDSTVGMHLFVGDTGKTVPKVSSFPRDPADNGPHRHLIPTVWLATRGR